MIVSERGIALIKEFEGFRSEVYEDVGGIKTIGYGHVLKPHEDNIYIVDEEGATLLMLLDLIDVRLCISSQVKVELNQNKFDALACLIFNIGTYAFSKSTLLSKINNACDANAIIKQWLRWCFVQKKFYYGLKRRRKAEIKLYQESQ